MMENIKSSSGANLAVSLLDYFSKPKTDSVAKEKKTQAPNADIFIEGKIQPPDCYQS